MSYRFRDDLTDVSERTVGGKKLDARAKSEVMLVFDHQPAWHASGYVIAATLGATAASFHEEEFEDNLLLIIEIGELFFRFDTQAN